MGVSGLVDKDNCRGEETVFVLCIQIKVKSMIHIPIGYIRFDIGKIGWDFFNIIVSFWYLKRDVINTKH